MCRKWLRSGGWILLLGVVAGAGWLTTAAGRDERLGAEQLAAIRVGDTPSQCCTWGRKLDCDSAMFRLTQCRNTGTIVCTVGENVRSVCNASTCGPSTTAGQTCVLTNPMNRQVKLCRVTGVTTTGCPEGQSKCTIANPTMTGISVRLCSSLGDACANQMGSLCQ